MFVCWSFSTFSGKEWTPGVKDLLPSSATGCDTDQWARTAKEAGMGYILFLTKHHDGFCLWDTKTTARKVTKAPLGRDVLAELRKSATSTASGWPSTSRWASSPTTRTIIPGGYTPRNAEGPAQGTLHPVRADRVLLDGLCAGRRRDGPQKIAAWVKQFQPGCFVGFNGGGAGDLRAGEMGRPGPVKDFLVGEFTYPILPGHEGGAMWFYSLPQARRSLPPRQGLYRDYRRGEVR